MGCPEKYSFSRICTSPLWIFFWDLFFILHLFIYAYFIYLFILHLFVYAYFIRSMTPMQSMLSVFRMKCFSRIGKVTWTTLLETISTFVSFFIYSFYFPLSMSIWKKDIKDYWKSINRKFQSWFIHISWTGKLSDLNFYVKLCFKRDGAENLEVLLKMTTLTSMIDDFYKLGKQMVTRILPQNEDAQLVEIVVEDITDLTNMLE